MVPELPILVYWHFIVSDDLCDADFAEVKVNGDSITSYSLCYDESTNGWEQKVIDLSAFSGQTIDLQIRVSTDQSIISSLYVDDFSFESSAPAQNSELVTIAPVQQPPIMQKHP